MQLTNRILWCVIAFLCFPLGLIAGTTQNVTGLTAAQNQAAHHGLYLLMNGEPDAAIAVFKRLETGAPNSPVGFLLDADATWWKIYYLSANLIDPDVFDVVYMQSTPFDPHFEKLVHETISKSSAMVQNHQDLPRAYLFEGMAYALEARFQGLHDRDLPTARAGKKMRTLLMTAIRMDPNITDAYLGLGIYNYFVDTLPTLIKMLRFLIALPGGDRVLGLQQLRTAAQKGDFTRPEAQFYLAKDYTRRNEMQLAKALALFQGLGKEYPNNQLWVLLQGSVQIRLGRQDEGETLYRQVMAATAGKQSVAEQSIHRQAVQALARMHPNEKLE
ncbi:MAG TPA: tetratricopeptide repeat protein [Terriglobia bacterium]|nr:tetratricopeptide repeat protein [Terriglobia bacterium]